MKRISCGTKLVLCAAALVLLGTLGADTILASYDIHEQFTQREEIIMTAKQNGETVVSVPAYELKYSLKANRYALYGLYDIEGGYNNQGHAALASYYGLNVIVGTSGE